MNENAWLTQGENRLDAFGSETENFRIPLMPEFRIKKPVTWPGRQI